MNEPDRDTATIERELQAVEDALAEGRVTAGPADERELQELALGLADDTPRPRMDFAVELEERVREGFPRERRVRMPDVPRIGRHVRRPLPVAATLAALLIAIGVAVSLDRGEDASDPMPTFDAPAPESAAPQQGAAGAAARKAPSVIAPEPVPPGGDGFEPGRKRRIERTAAMTLAAPSDELDRVADQVTAITDRYRGYVLRSSVTSGDDGATGGNFELRIPGTQLRPALRDLAGLAEVRSRTQSGEDVTREYVGARDRLDAARAERRSLLRRLERADSDGEAESIRRRLDVVASQINSLRGQLRELRLRTDYVAVSLSLVEDKGDGGGSPGGGFHDTDDALDDALGTLAGAVNLALRVLGVLIPVGLLAGAAWLAARILRRRRREAALG